MSEEVEDELPKRSKLPYLAVLLGVAAIAGGLGFWRWSGSRPRISPERFFFAETLPMWALEHHRGGGSPLPDLSQVPPPVSALSPELEALGKSFPKFAAAREAAVRLNKALEGSGLRYWLDVQQVSKRPIVLSYALELRTRWKMGDKALDVMRVRRLDRLNIEMGMEGLTDDEGPVVFLDRLEPNLSRDLEEAFAEIPKGNEVDRAARAIFRGQLESKVGAAAVALAAGQLRRRSELFEAMEKRMHEGQVTFYRPEGFVWGDEFFERLEPYAKTGRPRGPLLLASDLRQLHRADEVLREGEGNRALLASLELESSLVEAHEARHALDPSERKVPEVLVAAVGDDDMPFANKAERELRALIAEIHDGAAPSCLAVARIVQMVAGRYARATPHWYASSVLLREMFGEGETYASLPAKACAMPDAQLRSTAAEAFKSLYGEDFVGAAPASAAVP